MNDIRPFISVVKALRTVAPERIWKWGHPSGAKRQKIFLSCPPLFCSKSKISRFGEHFRDEQYSLVSFLFAVLLLAVPPCPAICKSGGTCFRALWNRRHCLRTVSTFEDTKQILFHWNSIYRTNKLICRQVLMQKRIVKPTHDCSTFFYLSTTAELYMCLHQVHTSRD